MNKFENNDDVTPIETDIEENELSTSRPAVASSKSSNVVFFVIGLLLMLLVAYLLLSGDKKENVETKKHNSNLPSEVIKPAIPKVESAKTTSGKSDKGIPITPPIIAPPEDSELKNTLEDEIIEPSKVISIAPPPPPPPAPVSATITSSGKTVSASQQEMKAKLNSSTLIGGSNGRLVDQNDPILKKGTSRIPGIDATEAPSVNATAAEDPEYTLDQGKIIDAVLETAINTDLPGLLRAVVSRDVYAEQGRNILIPKGSRIVGNYQAEVKRGQNRVYITWDRIIRPDGIDIMIGSPGIDTLGRSGASGFVDAKYQEIFANTALLSAVIIGLGAVAQEMFDSEEVTTTQTNTGTQKSGRPVDVATLEALEEATETTKSVVGGIIDTRPTITVEQGTRIKIFVNKDVIFPPLYANGVEMIR